MDDDAPREGAPSDLPPEAGDPAAPAPEPGTAEAPPAGEPGSGRPFVERFGMAAIALLMAGLFGIVAITAFSGGELFLAAMGAVGCLVTIWVGAVTLVRG